MPIDVGIIGGAAAMRQCNFPAVRTPVSSAWTTGEAATCALISASASASRS
ncbi:MAG: hypothetical protein R3C61_27800 [Bacteroidia bacterium]